MRVKLSMISTKLREKVTKSYENVSEAQVAKYYSEHKSEYVKGKVQQSLEQVKSTIRQQLSRRGHRRRSKNSARNSRESGRAKTECRAGYVVKKCKEYKAPKTTPTGAAGTPGAAGTE